MWWEHWLRALMCLASHAAFTVLKFSVISFSLLRGITIKLPQICKEFVEIFTKKYLGTSKSSINWVFFLLMFFSFLNHICNGEITVATGMWQKVLRLSSARNSYQSLHQRCCSEQNSRRFPWDLLWDSDGPPPCSQFSCLYSWIQKHTSPHSTKD